MALIRPRNPFAYPGGTPGVNYRHPASKGLWFSGVATGGNSMICLNSGSKIAITGSIGSSMTQFGPAITNSSGTSFLTFTAPNLTINSSFVSGAIFIPTSSATTGVIFATNGTAGFASPQVTMSIRALVLEITVGSTLFSPGLTLTSGVPYFIGVRGSTGGSGEKQRYVAMNLNTGQYSIVTLTTALGLGITMANSAYVIGGKNAANTQMGGSLMAVQFSADGDMTGSDLTAWAFDPWSFWYPPTTGNLIFASLKGQGNTGQLSVTEIADTVTFNGTNYNDGTLSVTEIADTVVFNGTNQNRGTLSVTEIADTVVFNGTNQNRGILSVTEIADTVVFNGTNQNRGILSVTEIADTVVFNGLQINHGVLSVTEIPDIVVFNGSNEDFGTLRVTETPDRVVFNGVDRGSFDLGIGKIPYKRNKFQQKIWDKEQRDKKALRDVIIGAIHPDRIASHEDDTKPDDFRNEGELPVQPTKVESKVLPKVKSKEFKKANIEVDRKSIERHFEKEFSHIKQSIGKAVKNAVTYRKEDEKKSEEMLLSHYQSHYDQMTSIFNHTLKEIQDHIKKHG